MAVGSAGLYDAGRARKHAEPPETSCKLFGSCGQYWALPHLDHPRVRKTMARDL